MLDPRKSFSAATTAVTMLSYLRLHLSRLLLNAATTLHTYRRTLTHCAVGGVIKELMFPNRHITYSGL